MQTRHLDAQIDDSTQFVTVFSRQGRGVMGTLQRRRVLDYSAPNWRALNKSGVEIGAGFDTALAALRFMERSV